MPKLTSRGRRSAQPSSSKPSMTDSKTPWLSSLRAHITDLLHGLGGCTEHRRAIRGEHIRLDQVRADWRLGPSNAARFMSLGVIAW